MQIVYHKRFKKAFARQSRPLQQKFFKVLELFIKDQSDKSLNVHALKGGLLGVCSFDVTGDLRVHYEMDGDICIFINIGTHAQLYK